MIPIHLLPALMVHSSCSKYVCIAAFAISMVLYLLTYWFVKFELIMSYRKDKKGMFGYFKNTIVHIIAEGNTQYFMFERARYVISGTDVIRIKADLNYTLKELRKIPRQQYHNLFPKNELRIPKPSFLSLFKEQCLSPLFCFQIFSSLIMCFDEYVMQSLFSITLSVFIEAVLVFARTKTMAQFRKVELKSVLVEKMNEPRGKIESVDLCPGDLVKITSKTIVSCDMLVLEGECAVNEAMLSGESVPLKKEPAFGSEEIFSFTRHRKHVLFGGTSIEVVETPLVCLVLRTGFDTEQGKLLNKMLSSEDMKYDPDALKFIMILSVLSLVSCIGTYMYSKKTGKKLVVDLLVLFTSSIPFELPMEMGVSIQNAVKNLIGKRTYCLEPFRITLAGKVEVCCFDKTGTLTSSDLELKDVLFSNSETLKVLSACHSLVEIDGKLRGEPVDETIRTYLGDNVVPHQIFKNFTFSSEMKRQGVVADFDDKVYYCVKGAPEVIERMLLNKPDCYDEYKRYAAEGMRVIALAYSPLSRVEIRQEKCEKNGLEFCGFVLFSFSIKTYAREMCAELSRSGHRVVMITGDNLLTAKNVAKELKMGLIGLEGDDIENYLKEKELGAENLSNNNLACSNNNQSKSPIFEEISIFARASPSQKEMIIKKYKKMGFCTMMVGDGTNDVGALKAADVGVAILDSRNNSTKNSTDSDAVMPGDASIAAPFTVRSDSLRSIIDIILQGRTSLVTTIQMYKILALNALTNAFFFAFIDILGVKFSEYQMFSVGILSALAFQAISSGAPLVSISNQRPLTTIFNFYVICSLFGQSLFHIISFFIFYYYIPHPIFSEKYIASTMNTVLYVLSCSQTISTFITNYIGRPFRENINENKLMLISIISLVGFIINIFTNIVPDLNDLLGVVSLSSHTFLVISIVLFDSVFAYIVEKLCFYFFMLK